VARRRPGNRGRGGGGGGGLKGGILTAISLVLVIGFALAWAQSNNIKGISGALEYFRTWSAQIQDCGVGDLDWRCETPIPDYDKREGGGDGAAKPRENVTSGADVSPTSALAFLDSISLKNSEEVEYARSDWKHWSDLDGNGCDSREDTLIKSGTSVTSDPGTCKITGGSWVEPYANSTITDSSKIDIDHVVALSWAASNGGQALSADQKQQLANDPLNLYISKASENRSKGDKGPGDYLPPNEAFQCQYVTSFVTVVDKYSLTMPKTDAEAVRKVLETKC
jgi:hypothetical protein